MKPDAASIENKLARLKEKTTAYSKRGKAIQRRVNAFCISNGFIKSKKSGFVLLASEHWVFWLRPLTRSGVHSIEIESGLRVLNSSWPGLHLNGINVWGSSREVNTWYVNSDESEDRCVTDLCRFIEERVFPWYREFSNVYSLLSDASPLMSEDKECLTIAIKGDADPSNIAKSKALLGMA